MQVHSFRETVPLLSACFSADGRTVAATGDNGQLRLFDTGSATATAALAIEQGAGRHSCRRLNCKPCRGLSIQSINVVVV